MTVVNSILWGNAPQEILPTDTATASIRYSDIAGGWPGAGNVILDPAWAPGGYHLQSCAGHWDPTTSQCACDAATSPCIDAGDPQYPVGQEPVPNGGIINLGAYGGTATASKSGSRVP